MLGALPTDEEQVHVPNANGQTPLYDFFGLGQPGQMPFHLQVNAHGNENVGGQNNNDWDNWPENEQQNNAALDLNQAPADMLLEDNPIPLQQQEAPVPPLNIDLNATHVGQSSM
jgi:hypothetical protein